MKKYFFKQANVYPVTSENFVGDVLVEDGKIVQMGPNLPMAADAIIIDCINKYLYCGLVDGHTHLGLYDEGTGWAGNDANEKSEAITPHIRAIDGVYPLDIGFRDAIKAGITCVNVMPGSQNIIGGTTSVIKTYGKNIEKMIIKKYSGLKLALGENPKKYHEKTESMTRMGIMGLLRETFINARHASSTEKCLPRVLPVVKALNREYPVRVHAHRADDIISALRFAKEFDLDLRIEHCTEGHLIIDELKEYSDSVGGLNITIGPTMTRRSKVELRNKSWVTYGSLVDAGLAVSITTDHPYIPIQYLNINASVAIREGLKEEDALRGITINPAINLGVDNRVGSIEIGKDADLVVWSGKIFDYLSKPVVTMINGEIVYSEETAF